RARGSRAGRAPRLLPPRRRGRRRQVGRPGRRHRRRPDRPDALCLRPGCGRRPGGRRRGAGAPGAGARPPRGARRRRRRAGRGGARADVVIEAAGTTEAWGQAVELVRPGGTVVFFGGLSGGTSVTVDATRLHYEELKLRGTFHHTPRTVRAALAFLASGAFPWQ